MKAKFLSIMRIQFSFLQVTSFCYSHFTKYIFLTFFLIKICICQKKVVPLHRN